MNQDSDRKPNEDFDERLYREAQPPEGQRLVYHALYIAEVFQLEDFQTLESGLNRMYDLGPEHDESYQVYREKASYRDFIGRAKSAFLRGGWVNLLGFVSVTQAEKYPHSKLFFVPKEMPRQIKYLSMTLHQTMPSMIFLVVRALLDECVSDQLREIFIERHSERIEKHERYQTHYHPHQVKTEEVQRNLRLTQTILEEFIADYLKGGFLSKVGDNASCRCPAMRLFSLQYIPFEDSSSLSKWMREHQRFIDTMGYLPVPEWTYHWDYHYILFSESTRREADSPMAISLLSSESLFQHETAHSGFGTPIDALVHKHNLGFAEALNIVAIDYYVRCLVNKLMSYRGSLATYRLEQQTTAEIMPDVYTRLAILKSEFSENHFVFRRFKQEFDEIFSQQNEPSIYREVPEFAQIEKQNEIKQHFCKRVVDATRFIGSYAAHEYALLESRLSEMFEMLNIQVNYALADSNRVSQRRVLTLTIVIAILTFLMLFAVAVQIWRGFS